MISRYSLPAMSSIWSDEARLRALLKVELEFLRVLAKPKKIPAKELALLEKRIDQVTPAEARRAEERLRHDVAAALEAALEPIASKAPQLSRYLHYGLTSSDLLDTALALQAVESSKILAASWAKLAEALALLALKGRGLPTAGRTHGVHAEPTSFAIKVAGFHAEALRNKERIERAGETMRFGKLSGAVGHFAHLDPAWEFAALQRLDLRPEPVSTQVIPRDRHAEFLFALALSAAAVERLALEVRHLSRSEVGEVLEPFGEAQKGSSAMPHKRNPILSENLCGLARLLRAYAGAALEDVALWHERDISHSSVERVIFPDACIALHFMLERAAGLVENLALRRGRVRENLDRTRGLLFSQKVLLALVDSGVPRLEAYSLVQDSALRAESENRHLGEVLKDHPAVLKALTLKGLAACFDVGSFMKWESALLRRSGIDVAD